LGDFGLATRHRTKPGAEEEDEDSRTGIDDVYEAIGDIRRLLGEPALSTTKNSMFSSCGESMTGGVGTTFYRAPEQEGKVAGSKSDSSYTVQADIFSFGIILFEMFHVPFPTYMERAETLTKLRGDTEKGDTSENPIALSKDRFRELASRRFPLSFLQSTPENAQRYVLNDETTLGLKYQDSRGLIIIFVNVSELSCGALRETRRNVPVLKSF
jgi:serine/threonine protein kinase